METIQLGASALILRVTKSATALETILSWQEHLHNSDINGLQELLPCYHSLTVFFDSENRSYHDFAQEITSLLASGPRAKVNHSGHLHEIPVCYEGHYALDLGEVASHTGLTPEEVITLHSSGEYVVAGLGFSPGFGFLKGLPPKLKCPRLTTPRTTVPSGSVGIANDQTGIYPSETAGGWNLIGRTPTKLIDYSAAQPSRFKVGDRIKFIPITEQEFLTYPEPRTAPKNQQNNSPNNLHVLSAGPMTTIQDLGRTKYRNQGLPKGGAMDRKTVTLLNSWLGNDKFGSVIEFCQIGVNVQFSSDTFVMIGGSCLPKINGIVRSPWSVIAISAGDILDCGVLHSGLWGYLAIQGGFQVPALFGSTSTHPHLKVGGLNGRCLEAGNQVPYAPPSITLEDGLGITQEDRVNNTYAPIRCERGAQWEMFSEQELTRFLNTTYAVSQKSNRVGYRLEGALITKKDPNYELTSEGACPGTIQITNSGQPIVLMADAQSIGGYPKIAHIIKEDQSRFAQLRPGMKLRFELTDHSRSA